MLMHTQYGLCCPGGRRTVWMVPLGQLVRSGPFERGISASGAAVAQAPAAV